MALRISSAVAIILSLSLRHQLASLEIASVALPAAVEVHAMRQSILGSFAPLRGISIAFVFEDACMFTSLQKTNGA
jgi:hypothetical protein